MEVTHDHQEKRFFVRVDGKEAFLSYRKQGDVLDFHYTFVPPELRGKNLAEEVVKAGFEYARANNLKVIPSCPYVGKAFLKRQPQYAPLVAGS